MTVFRDQEFSADQGSRVVRRIAEVRTLRAIQFPEDDGPLAHPVRPDSYITLAAGGEIANRTPSSPGGEVAVPVVPT